MRATVFLIVFACAFGAASSWADTFEPNDTIDSAYGPLESGVPIQSMIATAEDVDWYYLDADAGDLAITLTGIPEGTDYDLCLADHEGNFLVPCSDAEGNVDERIDAQISVQGRFWIRVRSAGGSSPAIPYELTASYIVIVHPPVVALAAPNGGEVWTAGTEHAVTWSADDLEDGPALDIDIDLSLDGGASWAALAAGIANTGSFDWTVPDTPSDHARVRVTARDSGGAAASDSSAADFRILPAPGHGALAAAGDVSGAAGSIVTVPVTLANDRATASLAATIGFPANRLAFVDAAASPRAAGLTFTATALNDHEVRVTFAGAGGASIAAGDGAVATLRLRVDHFAAAGDTAALHLSAAGATDTGGQPLILTVNDGKVTVSEALPTDVAVAVPSGLHLDPATTLPLPLSFRSNVPLTRFEFTLSYDPAVLTAPFVAKGPALAGLMMDVVDLAPGTLRVRFGTTAGPIAPADTAVACTVTFTTAAATPPITSLAFADLLARGPRDEVVPVSGQGGDVVPVTLLAFFAEDAPEGVRVRWQVADATAAAGFRVLREHAGTSRDQAGAPHDRASEPRDDTGTLRAIHDGFLSASATEALDATALPGASYRYWLEALGRDGALTRFGPVEVTVSARRLFAGVPYPNPMRSSVAMAVRGRADAMQRAVVIDVAGRVVRDLAAPPGATLLKWDGHMAGGTEAPAGIYFLLVTQGDERVMRRVVKLGG